MKDKLSLFTKQKYEGGEDVQLHSFLTLEQDASEWSALLPIFFTLSERATDWIRGRGGPQKRPVHCKGKKNLSPCKLISRFKENTVVWFF